MKSKKTLARFSLMAVLIAAVSIPGIVVGQVDDWNVPVGEERDGVSSTVTEPPAGGGGEVFVFPATGDERFTLFTNFWNEGDYVQGDRTFTAGAGSLLMTLQITDNFLSCDTQDHDFMIDGVIVGGFSVSSGDTEVIETFTFPTVGPGSHTLRIETNRTVNGGCGSANFPDDVSTIELGAPVPTLPAGWLIALAILVALIGGWAVRRRVS